MKLLNKPPSNHYSQCNVLENYCTNKNTAIGKGSVLELVLEKNGIVHPYNIISPLTC